MNAATEIALVPKENALQVYSTENGLDPYLQQIRTEIDAFNPDVSTRKGREAIASIAHKVARSKTALDNIGKELVADLKEVPKKIDAERKRMRDLLDAWKDEVRQPLTEWEQREEMRKDKHQAGIDQINLRLECRDLDSTELKANIEWLEGLLIGENWEEFETEAARAKDRALAALREALVAREKYEAEQAELERLRAEAAAREQKEREERIAREAAEAERLAAERRAQEERDATTRREAEAKAAAERRELELKLQAEQAEREKLEAQRRAEQAERDAQARAEAAAAAERQRQADEQARIQAETKAREKDRAHKAKIMGEAKDALISMNISEELAKAIILKIARREVPNVTINF
ncbi:hypothetical protein A9C11_23195 [Pseudomonas citronellolis]|uniref:Uncharacterized protein n=1 Tax=Pseudomonas citronellolis TaxID=53408 RepID=A0A1A9KIA8_9PSED|nr:hypothetical protein [Pseudomonas citronellolis]ANI16693.1 hypothetical protein A9C11_23195 [Pseudomonas citronellolis]